MNYIQETTKLWAFPETIGYETVPGYLSCFMELTNYKKLIFDLSRTKNLHTSFIGFLLHSRQIAYKNNMDIKLILSPTAANILKMLELHDFLTTPISKSSGARKKSA
jgi:hypothetical protein